MDVSGMTDDAEMDWETVPSHLKEDETFAHAVRDIIGNQ
jgi:hypothetical protein